MLFCGGDGHPWRARNSKTVLVFPLPFLHQSHGVALKMHVMPQTLELDRCSSVPLSRLLSHLTQFPYLPSGDNSCGSWLIRLIKICHGQDFAQPAAEQVPSPSLSVC